MQCRTAGPRAGQRPPALSSSTGRCFPAGQTTPCLRQAPCGTGCSRTAAEAGCCPVSRPRKGVREAVLEYRIVRQTQDACLAEITLHTGRTHQIRVQFASRKHPLWGDGKYGSRMKGAIALQSCGLQFVHPDTGRIMNFTLPLPDTAPWNLFAE